MKEVCQWIILIGSIINILRYLFQMMNGEQKHINEAYYVLPAFIISLFNIWCIYQAGSFTEIFK